MSVYCISMRQIFEKEVDKTWYLMQLLENKFEYVFQLFNCNFYENLNTDQLFLVNI